MNNCTVQATLNQRIVMRDGVELSTNIYLPDTLGPFPVLLARTPYDAMSRGSGVLEWPSRGFAYVAQDVRGRFLSDGEWYPWFAEINDGEDTLNWIAAQSWCDGNVAMYGGSYPGATQIAAALTGHPVLKCTTPCLIGGNFYHTFYWGGALRWGWQTGWTLGRKKVPDSETVLHHLPLRDADIFAGGKELPYWQDLLRHPLSDEFWQSHNLEGNVGRVQAPMFIRSGWFDFMVGDILETFSALKSMGGSEEARKFSRILIGPWPHNINQQVVGEEDFGEVAVISDLYEQEIAYIERLTKERTEPENVAPIRLFIMGKNQWRDEQEWPLARTVWTDWLLAGDGVLGSAPSGAPDGFDYDPANPVPTHGGAWNFDGIGPYDQTEIEERGDVLVFSSEVLSEDMEVTGPVEVKLFASSSARDTDFTAKLVDVRPDGRAMSVTDGIVRARYRNPERGEELLVSGEVYEFTIRCNPTAYMFGQGHKIRVEISSSNFPAFARNLNTGGDIADETEMQVAHQTIYHSPEYPSRIILPVV
ncbi:MAG: CocE/NonD family hydrolase [Abditibacteriaceae bacterium]